MTHRRLTPQRAQLELAALHYPQHTFALDPECHLLIRFNVVDAEDPSKNFVGSWRACDPIDLSRATLRDLHYYVATHLGRFRMHELFENLRIQFGEEYVPVFAPHSGIGGRLAHWRLETVPYNLTGAI